MPGSKHAMPGVSMVGSMLKDGMPRVLILMMILLAAVQPVDVVEYDAIESFAGHAAVSRALRNAGTKACALITVSFAAMDVGNVSVCMLLLLSGVCKHICLCVGVCVYLCVHMYLCVVYECAFVLVLRQRHCLLKGGVLRQELRRHGHGLERFCWLCVWGLAERVGWGGSPVPKVMMECRGPWPTH